MTRLEVKAVQQIKKLTDLQGEVLMRFEIAYEKAQKEPTDELSSEKRQKFNKSKELRSEINSWCDALLESI